MTIRAAPAYRISRQVATVCTLETGGKTGIILHTCFNRPHTASLNLCLRRSGSASTTALNAPFLEKTLNDEIPDIGKDRYGVMASSKTWLLRAEGCRTTAGNPCATRHHRFRLRCSCGRTGNGS